MAIFLAWLGMLLALLGVIGLVRRRVPLTRLSGGKSAIGVLTAGLALMWLGGSLLPPKPVRAERPQPSQETNVEASPEPVMEEESQHEVKQDKRIMIGEFLVGCRRAVREQLHSPGTAKFPGTFESDAQARETNDGQRVWAGWVDSQNGFGAVVRTNFVCTYSPDTGSYMTVMN